MTLLFYVDESRDKAHHLHLGLLVEGHRIPGLESDLDSVVIRELRSGNVRWPGELHAMEIFHGAGEWDGTPPRDRIAVFEDVLAALDGHNVEVIARGANLRRFAQRYGEGDPFVWEFSNLLERLNERLSARGEHALVIADQQHQHRRRLQDDLAQAKKFGTGGYRSQKLTRILDTAHFVDSTLSRMVQLADMAAFVLRRRLSHPAESDVRAEAAMDRLDSIVKAAIPDPSGQFFTVR